MKEEKNYLQKIENLLNAFSELTDEDIEEAKALIRAEGKDPDQILEKGISRLRKIQRKAARKYSPERQHGEKSFPFPVFLLDEATSEIEIAAERADEILLKAGDIYDIVVTKKDFKGVPFTSFTLKGDVLNWKFQRLSKEIFFKIGIGAEHATVQPFLRLPDTAELDLPSLDLITRMGYYNAQGKCYPVDQASMDFAVQLTSMLDNAGHLSVFQALNLYASRTKHRLLEFEQQKLDLQAILNSGSIDTASSLFVRDLYNYQQDGLRWLLYCVINRTGGILADDMGLGKTAQVIALVAAVLERKLLENILIVVPSTLLENWRREFSFFAPQIVPYIHHGSGRIGSPAILKQYPVVVTSYSMIINDQYLFNKIQWGITILDEASLIKNPESERKTALNGLESQVKIAMTGTPVENSLIDLWSVADYVYPGYLGDKATFTTKYVSKNIEQSLESGVLSQLRNDISFIMLRRKKEDVLDSLPEKVDIHQALTMHEGEAALYEEKRNEILNTPDQAQGAGVLKLIMDLRMYTTHPLLRRPDLLATATMAELREQSYKFSRMLELLREISVRKEKVLIFTEYLAMIDTLKRVLESYFHTTVMTIDGRIPTPERQINIDHFSALEGFGVMVLNPKTAGMGLNITAANHVIHYTRQWNPALEQQASARAYRNGQKKGVNIYYLYYADTIEEVIDERLRSKMMLSGEVIVETETENMQEYLNALSKSPVKQSKL